MIELTRFQFSLLRRAFTEYPNGRGMVDGNPPTAAPRPDGCFIVVLQTAMLEKEEADRTPEKEAKRLHEREFEDLVMNGFLECDGRAYIFRHAESSDLMISGGDPIHMVYLAKITDKGIEAARS